MNVLVPLPIVLPLIGAGLCIALRSLAAQRVVAVAAVTGALGAAGAALAGVERHGPVAVAVGGWPAPRGIVLVGDLLALLLLVVSLATVLAVLVYAVGQRGTDEASGFFHPLYLVLTAGVAASFLTGDLFNLFVAIEVMLSASYVLITLGGRRSQVRSGMTYVVINLLASTVLVTVIGLIYAATGTVNMADAALRLDAVPDAVRTSLGVLLLVTFGIKAAIFPLFFWLPDSYPTAPTAVTAVFAGLLTKVGVYTIIRTQGLLFPHDRASTLILVLAGLTMVVGVFGAIAQDDIKRILSFHIVSQIGYMIFGLGLFTVAGLAGAIFFVAHQIPVKTALFLVGGMVETGTGTSALNRLGGLIRTAPAAAALFLLGALSLAGLPPFSGFFGKLALVQAGLAAEAWVITGVSLFVSILTLFSMTKIWAGAFWGEQRAEPAPAPRTADAAGAVATTGGAAAAPEGGPGALRPIPRLMTWATAGLVGVTLFVAVAAQPIYELSERAAGELLDRTAYLEAVLEQ